MRLSSRIFSVLWLWLFLASAYAVNKPLEADQAFKLYVAKVSANEIEVRFDIAKDYYLYRKSLNFQFKPAAAPQTIYPEPHEKIMAEGGKTAVYKNSTTIRLVFDALASGTTMKVSYQGCASRGFCYPPMDKTFALDDTPLAISAPKTFGWSELLTDQRGIQQFLQQQNLLISLLFFIAIGLILAFTPCVLPMVPILTGIIVGQKDHVNTKKAFLLSLSYVLGAAITYAVVGVLAAGMGSLMQVALQKPFVIGTASVFFVLLSLSLFGFYDIKMPQFVHQQALHLSNRQKGGQYVGVFFMGTLSTLIISPCVTAPLIAILIYISQTKDLIFGAAALFALGIGMGIPLLVIGTSAGKWLPKTGPWMEAIKKLCGFAMIAMAIWMASRIMPKPIVDVLVALFLSCLGLFLAFYLPRLTGQHLLNKSLACIVFIAAGSFFYSAMPWHKEVATMQHVFKTVTTEAALQQELLNAREQSQPVLIDFYADWCESCVVMDKKVFAKPSVQEKLSSFRLLRIDLTDLGQTEEAIMKQYAVIAPPSIILIDKHGKEIESLRIVGELSPEAFIARIEEIDHQDKKQPHV